VKDVDVLSRRDLHHKHQALLYTIPDHPPISTGYAILQLLHVDSGQDIKNYATFFLKFYIMQSEIANYAKLCYSHFTR